jgi:uncharacterized protein (DUF302 family)
MGSAVRLAALLAALLGVAALPAARAAGGQEMAAAQAVDGDIQRRGDAYVIYLPGDLDYDEIVERLKSEIMAQNWEVMSVSDIGLGMRQYGLQISNQLILACKSQYLARALREDPYISLIIPCRFAVFRERPGNSEAGGPAGGGRIVIGFSDPVAEAEAVGVKQHKAAEVAADELKSVLRSIAQFYKHRDRP